MTKPAAEWRPIVAALADDDARPIVGALLAGGDAAEQLAALSPTKRARVVRVLTASGLAREHEGRLEARTEVFRELLRAAPVDRPTGIARFVRDGRIEHGPSGASDRAEVMAWAADRAVGVAELADEATVTERLAAIFEDPAALRRYLVDADLIEWRRDGSQYARPA
ncbi:DUF2087 domain-containing protein [Yonghaparkia sp. Soil809]|uniref:DUF2087 domain-containing protein n=1 Tax=Yonghaparkia sp. Soil809 TaxID=1736417 RepID=UPI0006F20BBB|nr:DUF2087 domain-containing protein [Yonghaparkia sp. Soil809]KRF30947.1 hypothetical protein ASG83_08880 [Yonghaparkia sp. Soil809]